MKQYIKPLQKAMNTNFPDTIIKAIETHTYLVEFPERFTPLRQGETSECLYFILEGMVRGYYLDVEGKEITKCFSREGEFFSSEGMMTRKEATFTIECLKRCKCVQIPYTLIDRLMIENREVSVSINRFYQMQIQRLEKKNRDMLLLDAEARYLEFCREYPELENSVELKHISTYIGIQPSSLSRIRRRLKKSHPVDIG